MLLVVAATAGARAPTLTGHASRGRVEFGGSTRIFGSLADDPGGDDGVLLELRADPYPFGSSTHLALTRTAADGSYSFHIFPHRNTRYRVKLAGPASARSPVVPIVVNDLVKARVRRLPLGRVKIAVRSHHPRDLDWGGRRAIWYIGKGHHRPHRVKAKKTRNVRPGLTKLSAVLRIPTPGKFHYGACFNAASRRALGAPGTHPRCGRRRFRGGRHARYQGRGRVPFGDPGKRRIARAKRVLASRAGYTSFAVMGSEGRMYGTNVHRRFVSASVVKAMLLVAYLKLVHDEHRALSSQDRSILGPMIQVSSNDAATQAWSRVGDPRLRALARHAGMTDFSIHGFWTYAMISAADQARFFFEMDRLIPHRFRSYADYLLSHIAGYESWGIPAVARSHGWEVFFKGGWRGTGRGQLVHQVARLEKGGERIAIAVMTDGDPSMSYGIQTIEAVTRKLVG
jgi:hypothetical protein